MNDDSIQKRLHERFESSPGGNALAFVDESENVTWLSFGEVYRSAQERAAVFACHGIGPGDVCILIPENDEFSTTSLLAVLILGAIPVCSAPPIVRGHHSNLKEVLSYLIRKTGAKAVIASDTIAPLVEGLREKVRKVHFLFGKPECTATDIETIAPCFPAATDVVAYQLTSGTTGFPKICVWTQRRVLTALDGMAEAMKISGDEICVNWTPLYHDMGLVNNFIFCMVQSVPLVLLSTFEFVKNPAMWLNVLSSTKATMTWSPNFGYSIAANWIRDEQITGIDLAEVRAFWNAAERIHIETMEAFHHRFSPYGVKMAALKTNFGMAENVGGATFSDPEGLFKSETLDQELLFKRNLAVPVTETGADGSATVTAVGVGRPYPGLTVKIISRNLKALPDSHVGEIAFVSPSRMEGYLSNAKETRKALVGDLLRTGDMGYQRNGEVFWLGRKKERINLNGKKYDPSDFEKALFAVDGLRKGCFAAFGIPDPEAGTERLVIVGEKSTDCAVSNQTLMRSVAGSINSHLGVKASEVILLEQGSMSKTSSGKRRHRFYRELYISGGLTESGS
ncbi:MAG: AMP-binding protein [Gammaproteobacteria bacterium]